MKPSQSSIPSALPQTRFEILTRPLRRFLAIESASGSVLLVCTIAALVIANTSLGPAFHHFWETHFRIGIGPWTLEESLHFLVNDGLMTIFFFVVGLEIKRELVHGELNSLRKASLPVIAALGGMLAPAGCYLALQYGQPGERGWGIPMATDIAFVVGVLLLFGSRVPPGLKIFLLSLAIADDVGAILVIAIAYTGSPNWIALALAFLGFAATFGMNKLGVRSIAVYVIMGLLIWLAVLQSKVHPTLAGVVLGLMTPTAALVGRTSLTLSMQDLLARLQEKSHGEVDAHDLKHLSIAAKESVSPLERLESGLHPWVGFLIMPIFALANAGVEIRVAAISDPIALAVAVGLIVGKPVGIVLFSALAVLLRLGQLPGGVTWFALAGAGCLGGIGFTMSLFIAGLALSPEHLDAGKIGILLGSGISAGLGLLLLHRGLPKMTSA